MYYVSLPCKPYVKRYIAMNFGEPADFRSNHPLYDRFRSALRKQNRKDDKVYAKKRMLLYSDTIDVIITDDDFNRYGWELTVTDIVKFGKMMEEYPKLIMRNMVSCYGMFMELQSAILLFQERHGYSEDFWKYESIRKDFNRNAQKLHDSVYEDLTRKVEKLFLANLSKQGTITDLGLKYYDNAQ